MIISGHDILKDITIANLEEMCDENPSFRGYLQGYLAERHLKTHLQNLAGVSFVGKIPDHHECKGDFSVVYLDTLFTVESKSIQSSGVKEDFINGGWQGSVQIKNTVKQLEKDSAVTTSSVPRGQFDVLAVSTFPMTGSWDFQFIANKYLPNSTEYPGRLATSFVVNTLNTPKLTANILEVFDELKSSL